MSPRFATVGWDRVACQAGRPVAAIKFEPERPVMRRFVLGTMLVVPYVAAFVQADPKRLDLAAGTPRCYALWGRCRPAEKVPGKLTAPPVRRVR